MMYPLLFLVGIKAHIILCPLTISTAKRTSPLTCLKTPQNLKKTLKNTTVRWNVPIMANTCWMAFLYGLPRKGFFEEERFELRCVGYGIRHEKSKERISRRKKQHAQRSLDEKEIAIAQDSEMRGCYSPGLRDERLL